MRELSGRVSRFTDSVIRRMTRISEEYDAINLSQGYPDFDPPREILEALEKAVWAGPHQYSITFGAKNLRDALAAKASPGLGRDIDPETEIIITCGGTEAMMSAMMTICNPGDKVAVFSPFYENYGADAILSGAEPIFVPLSPPDFQFSPAELEAAFRQGAKALIRCNPSNPTGKVFTREELGLISRLAEGYDAYVITDEVYEHIVFAPYRHISLASLPGMAERVITCSSFSKTYSVTGWRLGYTIAPAQITERIKKVHDFLTVGAAAPLQEAVVTALNFDDSYYQEVLDLYTAKRDLFCQGLDSIGLEHNVPQGTYFVMVDISRYLALGQFAGWSDQQFCESAKVPPISP